MFQIPNSMKAMVLEEQRSPLKSMEVKVPKPDPQQVLIKVSACGVCRTDLHIFDGELTDAKFPLILGHEIVGTVVELGERTEWFSLGDKVGVPWLGYTCGNCRYCNKHQENLCDNALFTGYTKDGGYAQYTVADHRYCFIIPDGFDDYKAAPLLCAGLIGYRSYKMVGGDVERLGIYGFGAAAHIITQLAVYQGKKIYAFTKPGDKKGQEFAIKLGAKWAGDSTEMPPEKLDGAIIFAPVGSLLPTALKATAKGATIVCGGIHMSDIPSFPYRILWEERVVRSVANLTRKDGEELLSIAPQVPIKAEVVTFPLEEANIGLEWLRQGKIQGATVLKIS